MKKIINFIKTKQFRQSVIVSILFIWFLYAILSQQNWQTADRSSAGIAPLPQDVKEAIVQVYAARTYSWRGMFAVHTWIALKEKNAASYTTYQVVGFQLRWKNTAVAVAQDIPDRKWYGKNPELIEELRGEEAEKAIVQIKQIVSDYPYAGVYNAWPGPNSNTFIAYIIRNVPELKVELPPNAIGKDWAPLENIIQPSEGGNGKQLSFLGILGVTIGKSEGIEFNILGLNLGIDFFRPALKLPLIGRVGLKDKPAS